MADVVHVTAQIRGIVRSQRRIVLSKVYYTGSEVPKLSTHTHTHTHTHIFVLFPPHAWCVQVLRSPKEAFAAAMQSWRERCEKCVCLQGDYIEK